MTRLAPNPTPHNKPNRKRSHRSRLRNFLHRPWSDQRLVVETFVVLGTTRFAVNHFSWIRLQKYLGKRQLETSTDLSSAHHVYVKKVAWAIRTVSPYTPWESNCFPQSLTGKVLLRRQGIESTLYIGASFKNQSAGLGGHAWLRCGPHSVTRSDGDKKYGAIISFG